MDKVRLKYSILTFFIFFFITRSVFSEIGLYKRIDLSSSPVKNCRMSIGDLNGDGKIDFVFNDGRRVIKAFDNDGNLLWEKFNPDDPGVEEKYHNFTISIYDIDLDGRDEVICFLEIDQENCLAVLEGWSGKLKTHVVLPFPAPRDHPYWGNKNYYMQDHVAIANLRGLAVPQDILAMHVSKEKVAAYSYEDDTLKLMWYWVSDAKSYASGHYAYPYDIDDDGRDEVIAGVDVLDEDGNRIWKMELYPYNRNHPEWGMDHVDAATCVDLRDDYTGKEIVVAAATGIWMYSSEGEKIWSYPSKEADPVNGIFTGAGIQEVLVGNFRSDIEGLEIVFYSEGMSGDSTVAMFDRYGNAIMWGNQRNGPKRLITYATDWDGDRSLDEIYSRKGIFDGYFNRLSYSMNWKYVKSIDTDEFPPIVCDFQGDQREEIIWYDEDEILIIYNKEPLNSPELPSPWKNLKYRLRYANNNHCNAIYFDWSLLEKEEDKVAPNPPVNLTSPEQTTTTIRLIWSSPEPAADGDICRYYEVYRDGVFVDTTSASSFLDRDLEPNQGYTYQIFAVDDAGNKSKEAAEGIFKTKQEPDTIPPNPPNYLLSPWQTDSTIYLVWSMPEKAEDGDVAEAFNIYRNGNFLYTTSDTNFTDENLKPSTEYSYLIYSIDDDSNVSIKGAEGTFQTKEPVDTIPPNSPLNLTSQEQTTTTISLIWSSPEPAADGDICRYYEVYRDGVFVDTTSASSFLDRDLEPNQGYTYQIFAVDDAGNKSKEAAEAKFFTKQVPDTIPPNPPKNLTSPFQTDTTILIQWSYPNTAEDGDSASFFKIFRDDSLIATVSITRFTDVGLSENCVYNYKLYSIDDADNRSKEAAEGSFSTKSVKKVNENSNSELYATIKAVTNISFIKRVIEIELQVSKKVVKIPSPLKLKESDGTEIDIELEGEIPGKIFHGIMQISDSLVEGLSFFSLPDSSLISVDGLVNNKIVKGDTLYIDLTPPQKPNSVWIKN